VLSTEKKRGDFWGRGHDGVLALADRSCNGLCEKLYERHPADGKRGIMDHQKQATTQILIVEDDKAMCEMLTLAFEQETSYLALAVPTGGEALQIAQQMKPSVLVLDYLLPDMDGITLYDQWCALSGGETIPVLLLTACKLDDHIKERGLPLLAKPFDLEVFLRIIETLLLL
jgi:CheY-like chemotaxis protein